MSQFRPPHRSRPSLDEHLRAFVESEPPPVDSGPSVDSMRSPWRDLVSWVERMSKRMALLLAVWGFVSVPASAGFAWWTSHQGFATQDQQAKLAATLREMDKKLDIVLATDSGLGPRVSEHDAKLWGQNERVVKLETGAKARGWKL